jgi:hypothetical protein
MCCIDGQENKYSNSGIVGHVRSGVKSTESQSRKYGG